MRRERHAHGSFAWLELEARDRGRAQRFYGELFGWSFTGDEVALEGDVIALITAAADGAPARWRSFVTVADAAAITATARALGATVGDAPSNGVLGTRVALTDGDGAAVSLWQPGSAARAVRQNEPGTLAWNELWTADPERAFAFYGALIGWQRIVPPGSEGAGGSGPDYVLLGSRETPGWTNGGLKRIPSLTSAFWLPYFEVADCDAAVALTVARGGTVRAPAVSIPRVGRMAAVHDPDGAALGFLTTAA